MSALAPLMDVVGPPSWWHLQHPSPGFAALDADVDCDVCVIGAGISGTSSAYHLAGQGADVVLLDAREVAGGASGRNGGFLLAGLHVRYADLCERVGTERAAALYALTVDGRDELLATAQREGLADFARRTGSLRLAVDQGEVGDLAREAGALRAQGFDVREIAATDLPAPLDAGHFCGGLAFDRDGATVPAAWVRGLATAAAARGVRVHEHSGVDSLERDEGADRTRVRLRNGATVSATAVVVCTEAWLPGLLPELDGLVTPYRSQLLATAPPPDGARGLPCPTWSRRGWDYAQQLATGHLVVGGEQREDVALYATRDEQTDPEDQAALEAWVRRVLGFEPEVLARWAGVLSISADGLPLVGRVPGREGVFMCGAWGGAGNVLGFVGGRLVAGLLAQRDEVPPELYPQRLLG